MTSRLVDSAGAGSSPARDLAGGAPAPRRDPVQRWRLVLRRPGGDAGAVQKAWLADLALRLGDAGLPVAGLGLDPPRPRVTLAAPLPAGIPGERELVDLVLLERLPAWRVREAAADAVGSDDLVDVHDVWLGEPPLPGRVTGAVYRARVAGPPADRSLHALLADAAAGMLTADALPRLRRKGEAAVGYDLRPFLVDVHVASVPDGPAVAAATGEAVVRATVRHDPEKGIGRPDEVLAELAERSGLRLDRLELVRERLLLADELAPLSTDQDPPPRSRGRATARPSARRVEGQRL